MQLTARLFLVLAALVATAAQEIQAQDPPKETMMWGGAYLAIRPVASPINYEVSFSSLGLSATFDRGALYQFELSFNWEYYGAKLKTISVLRGVGSAGRFYFVGAFAGVSYGTAKEGIDKPSRLAVGVAGNAIAVLRPLPFWGFGVIVRGAVTTSDDFQGVGVIMTLGRMGPFETR